MYSIQNLTHLTRCTRSPKQGLRKGHGRYWKPWEDRFLQTYKYHSEHRLGKILSRSRKAIHARLLAYKKDPALTLA